MVGDCESQSSPVGKVKMVRESDPEFQMSKYTSQPISKVDKEKHLLLSQVQHYPEEVKSNK